MFKKFLVLLVISPFFILPIYFNLAAEPSASSGIETALAEVAWLTVDHIEIETLEGDEVLKVYYVSSEFDMVAYRAEMLEIFRLLGTLSPDDTIDTVTIVSMADMGIGLQGIEQATIDHETVVDYAAGNLTRTAFLDALDIIVMEHGGEAAGQAPV